MTEKHAIDLRLPPGRTALRTVQQDLQAVEVNFG